MLDQDISKTHCFCCRAACVCISVQTWWILAWWEHRLMTPLMAVANVGLNTALQTSDTGQSGNFTVGGQTHPTTWLPAGLQAFSRSKTPPKSARLQGEHAFAIHSLRHCKIISGFGSYAGAKRSSKYQRESHFNGFGPLTLCRFWAFIMNLLHLLL